MRASTQQLLNLDAEADGYKRKPDRMLVTAMFDFNTGRVRIIDRHVSKE